METMEKKPKTSIGKIIAIAVIVGLILGLAYVYVTDMFFKSVGGCDGVMRNTVPFSEMEYARPDSDGIIATMDDVIQLISENSESYDGQLKQMKAVNNDYYAIQTMYTLATIKNSQDVTDQFFADEVAFYADFIPVYRQKLEELFVACAQSVHKEEFEMDYFGENGLDDYMDGGIITDESVDLSQYTQSLSNDYLNEAADPTIMFKGEETSLSELLTDESLTQQDRLYILNAYYSKYNKLFGEMYVEIVKSNMLYAEELGYDSYADYVYESFQRDYTPEEAAEYMDDIKEYMVPLYVQLNQDGWYNSQYDSFTCSEDELIGDMQSITSAMGGKISKIFNYMQEYELLDATASSVKQQMSYTTYIQNYDAPFIFINPAGDSSDILTVMHEFGHFVEQYINYGYSSGLDSDETASQAMEYLTLSYLDSCLTPAEMNKIQRNKLLDTLDVFIYQGYYNEFETQVYSLDYEDVTLENINRIAEECAEEFGLSELEPFKGYYSVSWVEVPHLFESPFYIISYCVSCDVALQVYELAETDIEKGVDAYYNLVDWDWEMSFVENLERAGFESPFAEGRAERCGDIIRDYFYN